MSDDSDSLILCSEFYRCRQSSPLCTFRFRIYFLLVHHPSVSFHPPSLLPSLPLILFNASKVTASLGIQSDSVLVHKV